jgi:Icc-related predicted phosphoesterase
MAIKNRRPDGVFIGGDLLPGGASLKSGGEEFFRGFLAPLFHRLQQDLKSGYPSIYVILGNDDPRVYESDTQSLADEGLWIYAHNTTVPLGSHTVYGYSFVPPTPFQLKDWELYDVSRYVDPGCISPEKGRRSIGVEPHRIRYRTIAEDLATLAGESDMSDAIVLFHSPPYQTNLDRAALDGQSVDHAPLDVHVGSIAIQRFIESRQPLLTLHGHIHESARLKGSWRDRIGRTHIFGAAHDGPELALVAFDPSDLDAATRELL